MTAREERREQLVGRVADHLLAHGLDAATLRPLAAAAGTSDRMLLYYFSDKDALLAAALEAVAARMAALLGDVAATPRPFAELLPAVAGAVRAPAFRPYMDLWLELAGHAARGREPHRAVAGRIADGFLAWAAERLAVEREEDRAGQAALLLALIDGSALLQAAGRGEAAAAAVEKGLHLSTENG